MTAAPSVFSFLATHKANTGVSDAELARRIGVTPQNLGLWRRDGLRRLPQREHLEAVAALSGTTSYEQVLDAALHETGYLDTKTLLLIPDDLAAFVLRSTAEQAAAQEKARGDRPPATRGHIDMMTGHLLAWLWRARPAWVPRFLIDYRKVFNENLTDDPNHTTITLDELLEQVRLAVSGKLTRDEVHDLHQAAEAVRSSTVGL
ncbi:hypothetical protein [Williamsia sterculiae]|uniref:Uncharacterized protein n=1 Tax=Williamsia sterculiae TaxID=1344003 RepID=A0A1N7HDV2_9NOCA|nr:hypothetical protein [Williamsia sterculiae]SIS23049.1 hypothetical protein SAMN05445060_4040 [Williamsia sterculiae]